MILASRENAITYRCPVCGAHVMSMVGVFKLSGDLIKLKCSCGGSRLEIARKSAEKIALQVPCLFCEETHCYTLDPNQFFSRRAFSLTCQVTGLEVCCIGTEEDVREYAVKQDEKLEGILRDCGFSSLEEYLTQTASARLAAADEEDEEDGYDEEDEVLIDEGEVIAAADFILSDLSETGDIHCSCEEGAGEYAYSYEGGVLQVFCRKCAAETEIDMRTGADLRAFLEIDGLELEGIPVIDFDRIPEDED